MLTLKISETAANAAADAVGELLNGGSICIYTGRQPEDADTPLDLENHKLLATMRFAKTAFMSAEAGVILAYPLADEPAATETGTANWFRAYSLTGGVIMDGSVGEYGADMNLNKVKIQKGARVSLAQFAYKQGKDSPEE